ncbi:MAG: response regulator transcription factor [Chloroflexi bacterium]|nr:response regulator transcription factor [Chloroflexota bacterium]
MSKEPIRIMIVDDHLLLREGLQLLLSTFDTIQVVAMARDGTEAIALCGEIEPHVILMDLVMPTLDGPTTIARIRAAFPAIQILALTSFVEEALIVRALQAGAIGYVGKDISAPALVNAIHAAHQGRVTIDTAAAQMMFPQGSRSTLPGHNLTTREHEVLTLLVAGMTNEGIAEHLGLTPGTIRIYVSQVLAKLGAKNRTHAAALARQYHLIADSA